VSQNQYGKSEKYVLTSDPVFYLLFISPYSDEVRDVSKGMTEPFISATEI